MSDEKNVAEPSGADGGSQPVAWRVYADDGSETVHLFYEQARAAADEWNWSVEPLYRSPTLTDEEREAVEWAAFEFDGVRPDNGRAAQRAATLRSLLSRLSPPAT